ncbi:hypothetical protein GLAREA_09993 [Glarea lozoyensis ATCC 20868]|uniref:Uncharacterized protein n=1 Tax=Glarea lozoyensis (strain ATCC 20868 / MF5171) TaxID=1116229 RepID=S3DB41_GLAL2|nr:uncharacterized protein GLAREA_09993 [Glarea lozoyensis ATCC 20868]EPE34299.1 hypothetical protein GLAREA_09993 [Glarea lozoyensis ATCC 20868]
MAYPDVVSASDAYRSPYSKLILGIIWGFQLAFLPVNVIILGLLVSIARSGGYRFQPLNVLNLVISLISLILICLEINMFQHRDLRPNLYLISGIVKLVLELGSVGLTAFKLSVEWKFMDWLNLIQLFFCLGLAVFTLLTFILGLLYGIYVVYTSTRRMKGLSQKFLNK